MKRLSGLLLVMVCFLMGQERAAAIGDFTLTDTDGTTHHLFEYLEQNDVVVLKFFFVGCHNCEAFAPFLDDIYEEFGTNGQSVKVLQLEVLDRDDATIDSWRTQYGTSVPAMGGQMAYSFWSNNIQSILGNSFTQAVILKANNSNPGASEVLYAKAGFTGIGMANEMSDLISANLGSGSGMGTGLTEMTESAAKFTLGPVPTYNNVTLRTAGLAEGPWAVEIFNFSGALIEKRKITVHGHGEEFDFDLSNLAPGNYFIALLNGQERWVQEISKLN